MGFWIQNLPTQLGFGKQKPHVVYKTSFALLPKIGFQLKASFVIDKSYKKIYAFFFVLKNQEETTLHVLRDCDQAKDLLNLMGIPVTLKPT